MTEHDTPFVLVKGHKVFVWDKRHERRLRTFDGAYGIYSRKETSTDLDYAQDTENGRYNCEVFDAVSRFMPWTDRYW